MENWHFAQYAVCGYFVLTIAYTAAHEGQIYKRRHSTLGTLLGTGLVAWALYALGFWGAS